MNTRVATQSDAGTRRSWLVRAVVGLEVLLAVGAIGGAVGLIGGGIDMGEAVQDLPFASPVFAGIALAVVNGLLPAVAAAGELAGRSWARPAHVLAGAALVGWIVVQVAFIGLGSWLQVTYFVYGVILLALAWRLRSAP